MRLTDLSPEWVAKHENDTSVGVDRYIDIQCPTCPPENNCGGMLLPVTLSKESGSTGWGWNGEEDFEKVTLTPSIWHHCKSDPHFFVTNGEIVFA